MCIILGCICRLQDPADREPGHDPGPVRHHRLLGQRGPQGGQHPLPPQDQDAPLQQQQNLVGVPHAKLINVANFRSLLNTNVFSRPQISGLNCQ